MKVVTDKQQTGEWFAARAGKVTASRLYDVMARSKRDGSPLKARADYMEELLDEIGSGETAEHFVSPAMERGIELEPYAISEYEMKREEEEGVDVLVQPVGFVLHPTIDGFGASPDGLVGDDGLIEVKCPNTLTHLQTVRTGEINPRYYAQMQAQMMCTERLWCDFVSYDPRLSRWPSQKLFIKRVFWDDEFIPEAEAEVMAFLSELAAMVREMDEREKAS